MKTRQDHLEDENVRLRELLKQAGLDAAESDVTYKLQRLLLAEMHHRIKNMMAMVQSIVLQTLRSDKTRSEATEAIGSRIAALSHTHDIILTTAGKGAQLDILLEELVRPFGNAQFRVNVPQVEVTSRTAVSLALVLNELVTNAVKYGSLSVPQGVVEISGRKVETDLVIVTWIEIGGPAVRKPARESFGTRLIRTALPTAPRLEYRPDGVFCELQVPLPSEELQISN